MKYFKKLGIVLNLEKTNEMAVLHAIELAKATRGKVYVLCPVSKALLQTEQHAILDHIKSLTQYNFELVFLIGKPIVEIVKYAHEHALDMLILEPTHPHGVQQFFFGSLALFLVRKAPCPVWIVKKPIPQTYERVLIAVDPLHDEGEGEGAATLNDKLIDIGTFFSQYQNAECHLASAWYLPGESAMHNSPFIHTPEEEIDNLKIQEKIRCASAFEKLQKRHLNALRDTNTHLLYGEPGQAISDFVNANNFDIVIMGTLARSGIKGFVVGNTAESILNQIQCSIIAIKPDDFVSPILA